MIFLKLIENIPFFSAFSSEEKLIISNSDSYFVSFSDGEYLIRENEEDTNLYILMSGRVAVIRSRQPGKIIAILESGSVCGEMSFLARKKRSANVLAMGQVIAFHLDGNLLNLLPLQVQIKMQSSLINLLVQRIEWMNALFQEDTSDLAFIAKSSMLLDQGSSLPVEIRFAGLSDCGLVRKKNEDNWSVDEKNGIFIVADGMGGKPAGDMASKLVTEVFPKILVKRMKGMKNYSRHAMEDCFIKALVDFNMEFLAQSRPYPAIMGMGATVAVLWLTQGGALIGHLGDSRLYLMRQGKLAAITQDHSILQYLIDLKHVAPKDAATHPLRGSLARYIGMKDPVHPEVNHLFIEKGDRFLLCTDGLTDVVAEEVIANALDDKSGDPTSTCRTLINLANAVGGKDNITAVIVDILGSEEVA